MSGERLVTARPRSDGVMGCAGERMCDLAIVGRSRHVAVPSGGSRGGRSGCELSARTCTCTCYMYMLHVHVHDMLWSAWAAAPCRVATDLGREPEPSGLAVAGPLPTPDSSGGSTSPSGDVRREVTVREVLK